VLPAYSVSYFFTHASRITKLMLKVMLLKVSMVVDHTEDLLLH